MAAETTQPTQPTQPSAKKTRLPLFSALSRVDRKGPGIKRGFGSGHGNQNPAEHFATHKPVGKTTAPGIHDVKREVFSLKFDGDVFVTCEEDDSRGDEFSGLGGFHAVGRPTTRGGCADRGDV